jgi:concanavalin A-like lectin/glucanase superfamily protein
MLAGCAFHHGAFVAPPADDAAPAIDAAPDAAIDAAAPFCDSTDPTLVACYAFENTLADGSPNGHDPNVMSNVTFAAGKIGQALVVGPTTEVDVPDSTGFDVAALTIEAWIAPAALPASGARAGILDCEAQYGFFLHDQGNLSCTAGGGVTAPNGGIAAGDWHHVACTSDGAIVTIYIDGTAVVSGPGGALSSGGTTGITLGGNNPPGGGSPLDGTLDQVRLYSAARTAAQICADAGRASCP